MKPSTIIAGTIILAAALAFLRWGALTIAVFLLTCGLAGCARDNRTAKEVKRDQEVAHVVGAAGSFIGIPAPIGEGIAGLALTVAAAVFGHKHGRKKERNCHREPMPSAARKTLGESATEIIKART